MRDLKKKQYFDERNVISTLLSPLVLLIIEVYVLFETFPKFTFENSKYGNVHVLKICRDGSTVDRYKTEGRNEDVQENQSSYGGSFGFTTVNSNICLHIIQSE